MWLRLDDRFATHPKVVKAGPMALALQIRAICYASQNLTDGFLPLELLPMLTYDLPAPKEGDWPINMVQFGLWEFAQDGYRIHDYLQWNVSQKEYKDKCELLSRKRSAAGKKGMKSRWLKAGEGDNKPDNKGDNKPITLQSTYTDTLNLPSSPPNPKKDSNKKRLLRSISDDDKPTEKHFSLAATLGIDLGPEWGKFKNYCKAHDKRYADFEAAFRNWLANAADMKGVRRVVS
jgi:hypothetical protein